MSQKEKEIFEAQLMKEAEIRDRLKEAGSSRFSVCLYFLKGPFHADIAFLWTDHHFFDEGGGVGKCSQSNVFSKCGSCCKQFFCVPVFLQTLYFLLAYNLLQCLQPLQTLYFKIFQTTPPPPTPCQKNNGPSLRSTLCLSHYLMSRKNTFFVFVCLLLN